MSTSRPSPDISAQPSGLRRVGAAAARGWRNAEAACVRWRRSWRAPQPAGPRLASLALLAAVGAAAFSPLAVGQAADPARPRTVALLFESMTSPFWQESIVEMRAQAARRGWSVLEAISNQDDNKQYQQVQSMIQRGVDGIVIIQTDNKAVIPAIRAANAAKVPMVHFNRPPAANDAYSVAIVADNRKIMAETVTALIRQARAQGGRYQAALLLGDLGDANAVARRDGFQDAIAQNGDVVEVVARIATEWNADKAFAGLTNALQAHPDINMIVSSSDFLTPQIEQALRLAGKWKKAGEPGHVLIASFDGDQNGYTQLEAGYFDVDGVQNLGFEVELAFDSLQRLWAGEKLPKERIDPGLVITRDDLLQKRGQMWGYLVAKKKAEAAAAATQPDTTAAAAAPAPASRDFADQARGFFRAMLSVKTLHDVLLTMLPLAILVAGQMLVLLIGQIDLAVTAVLALGSVISASFMTRHGFGETTATAAGIAACLGVGFTIGVFNGVCTAVFRIPSFVVTLAVMMAGSGAAVWYVSAISNSISIGGLPELFREIGYGAVAGVPIALTLCLLVLAVVGYVLKRTLAGRWIYAIGHNAQAARISGVPVARVTVAVFAASGLCAAIAAVILTSRIETGMPTLGQNMLLDVIGAAVIGGVSLFGGRGKLLMALGGVLFLSVLDKSLQLLGLSFFLVLAIKGIAILLAAIADVARQRRLRHHARA